MKKAQSIKYVKKRDGRTVKFDPSNVEEAIFKAAVAVGGHDGEMAKAIAESVEKEANKQFSGAIPSVEQIQDIVENVLIKEGHAKTAKAYILYRQKRAEMRESAAFLKKINSIVDQYVVKS